MTAGSSAPSPCRKTLRAADKTGRRASGKGASTCTAAKSFGAILPVTALYWMRACASTPEYSSPRQSRSACHCTTVNRTRRRSRARAPARTMRPRATRAALRRASGSSSTGSRDRYRRMAARRRPRIARPVAELQRASGRMTPRHHISTSPRTTIVTSNAHMCACSPATPAHRASRPAHAAPLRPATRRCGDAATVIRRSVSLRGFTRRRALSRTDASAAASCRDAVRSRRTRRTQCTRQPAGRQLDGNERRVHDARLARSAALQSCAPHARTHARTHADSAVRMNGPQHGIRTTPCRIPAPQPNPRALRSAIKIPARFRVRGPSDIVTVADLHSAAVTRHYAAASFSFFSARAFTRTLAGFAGNQRSSPVNGSLPKRFFFAGTTCAVIFSRPGSVNSPAPFL